MKLNNKIVHHIGVGAGFIGLILWYLLGQKMDLFQTITELFPASHNGAGFTVAIIIWMTPGFFIWKLFNRWIERVLAIKGQYYEDSYYQNESDTKKK